MIPFSNYPNRQGHAAAASAFPSRVDHSVNKAHVDSYASASPTLRSSTGTNDSGAFNGGGTGNKPILGVIGFDGMKFNELVSLSFDWTDLTPLPATLERLPYFNLVTDIKGDGSSFRIVNISASLPPATDNDFAITQIGADRWRYEWSAASNYVQIVGGPPAGPPVPPVPVVNNGPLWSQQAFAWPDIVAAYPDGFFSDVDSLDRGMPAGVVTRAFLVALGGSSNARQSSIRLDSILVNGVAV